MIKAVEFYSAALIYIEPKNFHKSLDKSYYM